MNGSSPHLSDYFSYAHYVFIDITLYADASTSIVALYFYGIRTQGNILCVVLAYLLGLEVIVFYIVYRLAASFLYLAVWTYSPAVVHNG